MASQVKVIDNTQKVKEKLAQALLNGLEESALRVQASASDKAPVDTGRLRASITYQVNPTNAIIGSNVVYARRLEYGHSQQAPQGFLRPALDEIKGKVKGIIEKYIKGEFV
jgi:HK97 gp10 family phage protein